jgi:uncharacterized protein
VVLDVLPMHILKLAAGVVAVLCGISLISSQPERARTPSSVAQAATGAVGGFLSTTTSLNGPPPALVSLIILAARAQIPHSILWPALPIFVAAGLLGTVGGLWIAHRLPARVFRSAVIVLVIIAGALTALSA